MSVRTAPLPAPITGQGTTNIPISSAGPNIQGPVNVNPAAAGVNVYQPYTGITPTSVAPTPPLTPTTRQVTYATKPSTYKSESSYSWFWIILFIILIVGIIIAAIVIWQATRPVTPQPITPTNAAGRRCSSSAPCPSGFTCSRGFCQSSGITTGQIGAACSPNGDFPPTSSSTAPGCDASAGLTCLAGVCAPSTVVTNGNNMTTVTFVPTTTPATVSATNLTGNDVGATFGATNMAYSSSQTTNTVGPSISGGSYPSTTTTNSYPSTTTTNSYPSTTQTQFATNHSHYQYPGVRRLTSDEMRHQTRQLPVHSCRSGSQYPRPNPPSSGYYDSSSNTGSYRSPVPDHSNDDCRQESSRSNYSSSDCSRNSSRVHSDNRSLDDYHSDANHHHHSSRQDYQDSYSPY